MTQQQKQFKVLLIGDVCRDVTLNCRNSRSNPEDPDVPLVTVQSQTEKLGMAGFVGECLRNLGLEVSTVFPNKYGTKSRYYKHDLSTNKSTYLLRVDSDEQAYPVEFNKDWITGVDAVVVSDYDKGFVSKQLLDNLDRECMNLRIPMFVDTKKHDLSMFQWAVIKINAHEASKVTNWPLTNTVVVTRGGAGARYKNVNYYTDPVKAVDVCGAGDAFLAGLVYGFLNAPEGTLRVEAGIKIGNKCGAVSVSHQGTYAPSLNEIR